MTLRYDVKTMIDNKFDEFEVEVDCDRTGYTAWSLQHSETPDAFRGFSKMPTVHSVGYL